MAELGHCFPRSALRSRWQRPEARKRHGVAGVLVQDHSRYVGRKIAIAAEGPAPDTTLRNIRMRRLSQ